MTTMSGRRVKVIVNGKPYVVEVGDLTASPITVKVDGRPYSVSIEEDALEVVASDHERTRDTSTPADALTRSDQSGFSKKEVKAPMPGDILDIAVEPGDRVQFHQRLCSLEAMKMKSAIHSPRDGIIASVEVEEGQAVAHNDVLFTFE